jgi:hypothetical protein
VTLERLQPQSRKGHSRRIEKPYQVVIASPDIGLSITSGKELESAVYDGTREGQTNYPESNFRDKRDTNSCRRSSAVAEKR